MQLQQRCFFSRFSMRSPRIQHRSGSSRRAGGQSLCLSRPALDTKLSFAVSLCCTGALSSGCVPRCCWLCGFGNKAMERPLDFVGCRAETAPRVGIMSSSCPANMAQGSRSNLYEKEGKKINNENTWARKEDLSGSLKSPDLGHFFRVFRLVSARSWCELGSSSTGFVAVHLSRA